MLDKRAQWDRTLRGGWGKRSPTMPGAKSKLWFQIPHCACSNIVTKSARLRAIVKPNY